MEYQILPQEQELYGIGNNYGGNNGFAVPPDPQLTTFGVGMQNLAGTS